MNFSLANASKEERRADPKTFVAIRNTLIDRRKYHLSVYVFNFGVMLEVLIAVKRGWLP